MRFREEKRLRRKDVLKAGVAAAVALALLAGGAAALHFWENDRYATGSDEVGSAVIAAPEEQKEITYDGSTYRQRSDLETYLIMGIDVKGKAVAVDSYEGGGQADVQMVLVVDDANKTWQVLQINRDTITRCRCWMFWAGWRRMPTSRSRWPIITAMDGRTAARTPRLPSRCCWTTSPSTDILH